MERARIIHSDEKVPLALRSEVLRSDHKFMIDKRALAGVLVMLGLTAPVACSTTDGDGAGGDGSSSGGSSGDPAADGGAPPQACEKPADCPSKVCTNKVCAAPSPTDGVMNADETDVDCGGGGAPKCDTDRKCKAPGDCASGVCLDKGSGLVCQAPSPTDGAKNGDETDVDCGGAKAPKCAVDKGCAADSDCESDTCSYAKKCVAFPSCKGNHGGDTCGPTGKESCCETVTINDGASFTIDKFQATAGRMRAFIEKTNGDLQTWVNAAKPQGWDDGWTDNLPSNMDEALYLLGPGGKRGCNVTNQGGRTYSQGPIDGNAAEKSDFSQDVLDEKALNCVTWYMAQALCAFDGKRLAKASETRHIFNNGGSTQYPWQFQDQSGYNPNVQDERLSHRANYETPNPPASMRLVNNDYPLDHAFYVAPPGSFPKGVDKYGVYDAAGNMLPWVNDGPKQFLWTFSWENHPGDLKVSTWNMADGPDGYYALGFRCAAD